MMRHVLLFLLMINLSSHASAQALVEWIDLPPEVSVTNGPTNGMWFTAPSDFVIKALKVPDASMSAFNPQSIAVLKFTGNGASSAPATNYSVLFLVQDTVTGDSIPCNINIDAGDHIGIIGSRWDAFGNVGQCSNAGIGNYSTTINGFPTPLYKLNANTPLNNQAPSNVWMPSTTAPIARVEMYYEGCDLPYPDSVIIGHLDCYGDTTGSISGYVSGAFGNAVMEWSTGDSNVNTISNLEGGSYVLSITSDEGCLYDTTITVNEPDSIMITATYEEPTCFETPTGNIITTTVGGTPGYQYLWSNGSTDTNLQGVSGGIYTLTVTDQNGCVGSQWFELEQPSEVTINFDEVTNNACPNDSNGIIQASISGGFVPYIATWDDEDSTSGTLISGLPNGTYTLTASDFYGCTASETISIIALHENPEIDLGPDQFLPPAGLLQLFGPSGFSSYLWSNGSNLSFISVSTPGNYWLQVTDENTCTGRDTIEVFDAPPTGRMELSSEALRIYPNPTAGIVRFELPTSMTEGKIEVYSVDGKLLSSHLTRDPSLELDMQALPEGVYIIRATSGEKTIVQRLVVR